MGSAKSARAKKKFGQHFLEPAWAERLVTAIDPKATDKFIEIGAGPGALTLRLAPRVGHLTAVEIDRDMAAALRPQLPENVTLVERDILEFDFVTAASDDLRVAGNLPYNISSPILFGLLDARRRRARIVDATLMVQREVADRIEGKPGTKDYGTLAIFVGLRASVRRVLTLPPGAFRPIPKVHSTVLRLDFREPVVAMADERTFEQLVRSIFTQRRKTLQNALKPLADTRGLDARALVAAAHLDGTRRPETLQLAELARLADAIASSS
jgi:16S rRNA (adenine1518-N6/adenine1519-N6)-dimethyltransferase